MQQHSNFVVSTNNNQYLRVRHRINAQGIAVQINEFEWIPC